MIVSPAWGQTKLILAHYTIDKRKTRKNNQKLMLAIIRLKFPNVKFNNEVPYLRIQPFDLEVENKINKLKMVCPNITTWQQA